MEEFLQLHALTLGLFEHIIRAIFYGYKAVLRRSDLIDLDGKPLVRDLRLNLHILDWKEDFNCSKAMSQ